MPSNLKAAIEDYKKEFAKDFAQRLEKTMIRASARIERFLKKEARIHNFPTDRPAGISNTGTFANSIFSNVNKIGAIAYQIETGAGVEYAEFIEFGRAPGKFPNLDAISSWVGKKFGFGNVQSSFDTVKAKAEGGDRKAREHLQVVYLVGRKIADKGIKGRFFFMRNETRVLEIVLEEIRKEFL